MQLIKSATCQSSYKNLMISIPYSHVSSRVLFGFHVHIVMDEMLIMCY